MIVENSVNVRGGEFFSREAKAYYAKLLPAEWGTSLVGEPVTEIYVFLSCGSKNGERSALCVKLDSVPACK